MALINGDAANNNLLGVYDPLILPPPLGPIILDRPDTINGLAGDDIIRALGTDDTLNGDGGNDTIYGGAGNDVIRGGIGNDRIEGQDGNDMIYGDDGNDNLLGGSGVDTIYGGNGNDTIRSDGDGGRYFGDAGNDSMFSGLGPEFMDGGAGVDTIDHRAWNGDYSFNMATGITDFPGESYINFENALMGNGNDSVIGTVAANSINGGGGNDTINGGRGRDVLTGGAGLDHFVFGNTGTANADRITDFSVADDTIVLANSLDSGMVSALNPGIKGLVFSAGDVAGSGLHGSWFFKGAGTVSQLSGVHVDTNTGNIFYDPTSNSAINDRVLLGSVSLAAAGAMSHLDFVYGA